MSSLDPPAYKRLLALLRQARSDAGLSQRDVARKLRKPQSFVSKCETGERRIDPIELEVLARLYGKPVEFFYRHARRPSR
jgi:transcriptional regulator with XRE-family HTH domain